MRLGRTDTAANFCHLKGSLEPVPQANLLSLALVDRSAGAPSTPGRRRPDGEFVESRPSAAQLAVKLVPDGIILSAAHDLVASCRHCRKTGF